MKDHSIHLGYEIGSGNPIRIPLKHMCITGQTQESGKTTTLEALITRSGLRAIAFITKRGEASFDSGRQIAPYFEERADWEFIESVLEAIMRQRMKFERAWIVKACKGAHTLADVQRNVTDLQAKSKRSMDQDLFMLLGEYLKKVVPLIQNLPKSPTVDLVEGLNVMDLRSYPEELQLLVISSAIRWVYQHEQNVITIVPEAWKFVPQGKNSPVKVEIRRLAREGAGLKNYIWIDSQDIAGVEKEILRAAAVWLIGVQRESNEIERALASIPKGIKRPSEGEIPRLKLGEFFACWGEHVHKVYVQPAWMEADLAIAISKGDESARTEAHTIRQHQLAQKGDEEMEDWKRRFEDERDARISAEQLVQELKQRVTALEKALSRDESEKERAQPPSAVLSPANPGGRGRVYSFEESLDNEQLYQAFKERLIKESPALIKVLANRPEIEVQINRTVIAADGDKLRGRIALLIHDGFWDKPRVFAEILKELVRRGLNSSTPNVQISKALSEFVDMGFFWRTDEGGFELAPGARKRVAAA